MLERLGGKPFWIWNKKRHKLEDIKTKGSCCFNHIIGLPRKDGVKHHNLAKEMRVVPVHFSVEHKAMLGHAKLLLEQQYYERRRGW